MQEHQQVPDFCREMISGHDRPLSEKRGNAKTRADFLISNFFNPVMIMIINRNKIKEKT